MMRLGSLGLAMGLGLWAVGCGCGGSEADDGASGDGTGCSDLDGDGFGVGPDCEGPDCDENNPALHECADCDVDPMGVGCPCEGAGEPEVCYEGPDTTMSHPPCQAGLRFCRDETWSGCEGQVLPQAEECNEADDDCDGEVDEGVLNSCGTCDEDCEELSFGGKDWDVENEGSRGLVVEDGALTLDSNAVLRPYIWIPNAGDSTVTKVNTRTWEEEGRYRLGPPGGGGFGTSLGGISTNLDVDVVVSASIDVPRVTRVNVEDCPAGDTSSGGGDVLDWDDDACVIWSTEIPTAMEYSLTTIAWEARRGLDAFEHFIWVGDAMGNKVIELTGDGELTGREVDVSPVETAGIAIDADGELWVGAHGLIGILTEVDPVEAEVVATFTNPGQKYDCIAADVDGKIWITGLETTAAVFDQEDEEFTDLGISVWGVAVDALDYVWFGGLDGLIYRLNRDDLDYETFDIGFAGGGGGFGGGTPYTGVDIDGNVWAVEPVHLDARTFPPDDPESFEVAVDTLDGPGACGDMTGTQLLYVVEPVGTYRHVFEGCDGARATSWQALSWDADVPGDSRIRFEVRTAADLASLQVAEWVLVGEAPTDETPLDVALALDAAGLESNALLEVKLTLLAGRGEERPLLREISVQRSCGGGPG